MGYPLDQEKWGRVREMMERNDLDAGVVRVPDNVLYLTNYWTMKGYDLAIFPREGDPTLLVIQPSFAQREGPHAAINRAAVPRSSADCVEQRCSVLLVLSSRGPSATDDSRGRGGCRC